MLAWCLTGNLCAGVKGRIGSDQLGSRAGVRGGIFIRVFAGLTVFFCFGSGWWFEPQVRSSQQKVFLSGLLRFFAFFPAFFE
jgi:hypothetical protein